MEVGFATVGDGLEEDEVLEVCVILTGTTEIDVAVTLSAQQVDQLPLDAIATGMYIFYFITTVFTINFFLLNSRIRFQSNN